MARITPCLENGKIARFCAPHDSMVGHGSTEFIVIRGRPGITDSDFAYYLTQWEEVRNYAIGQMTGTSGRQRVPADSFDHLLVPIPPLPEQRAIARILGALDDKIELNRRMSETLEQMARTLFKAWFVDFEPVRAKMEGRWRRGESLPGLPAHLYDLFPDRLVDSELGEIPDGWRVVSLESAASIQGGKQLPTGHYRSHGRFPVFGANGIMGYSDRKTHERFVIAFGRVGAYCGSIYWTYSGAWVNNNASAVTPIEWPEYILATLLHADFHAMRTGSAQPFIRNSSLAAMPVIMPCEPILRSWSSTVKPIRQRQYALENASNTLAALRDALLPKLIVGELRVSDVEP
ncbi:MAG: restriction endonuclease subunit S [Acidothermus cellulolyticus]|nr:restriction endonuclease subunit S [Acidothermus cellulolyticus]